jgi:hypothetical protein
MPKRPGTAGRLPVSDGEQKTLPVGRPLVRNRLVASFGRLCGLGLIGLLYIGPRGAAVVPNDRVLAGCRAGVLTGRLASGLLHFDRHRYYLIRARAWI